MKCANCGSENLYKNGLSPFGKQKYRCRDCKSEKNPIMTVLNDDIPTAKPTNGSDIMTEDQLRAKYDLSFIVQTALDQLQPGQFLNKEMLLKRCRLSVSGSGVSATLNSEQFKKFRGKAKGGELIFGHPTRISTLIEETVLSEI